MSSGYWLVLILAGILPLAAVGYLLGRRKPMLALDAGDTFHSTPDYYGWYAVIWMFAPALAVSIVAAVLDWLGVIVPRMLVIGAWIALPALALWPVLKTIRPGLRARNIVERVVYAVLFCASLVSILTTIAITLSVLVEAIRFFAHDQVSVWNFFTGTVWNPGAGFAASAGRGDESAEQMQLGSLPLFAGTFLITAIAMCVAVPVGVLSAVYMSEYAPPGVRRVAKPMLEVLAGIPTVVYGFFAAITVSPFIVDVTEWVDGLLISADAALASVIGVGFGYPEGMIVASSENALSPGIIMGVMIVPFMSSLSDDVISAVPHNLRRGALALGATESEVATRVVLPAALPGILSAFLISVSRAIGETMIVVMAAGMSPNLTGNPLDNVTTVTVQIVAALTGDQEFDSPMTLSAFGLGLTLLVLTLTLNIISTIVIRKFRKQYE